MASTSEVVPTTRVVLVVWAKENYFNAILRIGPRALAHWKELVELINFILWFIAQNFLGAELWPWACTGHELASVQSTPSASPCLVQSTVKS